MQQNEIKSNTKDHRGFELGSLERKKKKKDKMPFSAPPGSVCRGRFRYATMDVLGVKSLVEHDFEG